jgi:hypothetical protein
MFLWNSLMMPKSMMGNRWSSMENPDDAEVNHDEPLAPEIGA